MRGAARRNGPTERRDRAAGRLHNLTDRQRAKLAWVAKVNHQLFRGYLIN